MFAVITGMIYMDLYEDSVIKNYQSQLKKQVRRIAEEMSQFVIADDREGAFVYQDYIESMENSDTTDVWLIDNPDNPVVLRKEFTNADIVDIELSPEVKKVIRKAKKGKVSYASGYDRIYEKIMMCVAAPIYGEDDVVVGIVLMNSFVEQRDTLIAAGKKYMMYSIIAGIMIALIFALVFAKIITIPLRGMRQVAHELAKGNYKKRTHVKTKNEIGILANSMDMLAKRLEENELERQNMEQMRLDFFANVSHELRTPITVLQGYSESLADGVITREEKKMQYYERMVQECKRMERLVGDLLILSKVQNPDFIIEKENINIVQIFQDILRNYKGISDKKGIALHFYSSHEITTIQGDYDRLKQLFINIIDNAIKFSDEGGSIWITVLKGERIEVSVRDEGVGITEEELPNIFDKFYKSKLRQNAKGSGLGLVIAKYIVEKHGGEIQVDSQVGKGTEFRFYFESLSTEENDY